jgi:hypothetical protein
MRQRNFMCCAAIYIFRTIVLTALRRTKACSAIAGEGKHGSIIPSPGRVRSRNDIADF